MPIETLRITRPTLAELVHSAYEVSNRTRNGYRFRETIGAFFIKENDEIAEITRVHPAQRADRMPTSCAFDGSEQNVLSHSFGSEEFGGYFHSHPPHWNRYGRHNDIEDTKPVLSYQDLQLFLENSKLIALIMGIRETNRLLVPRNNGIEISGSFRPDERAIFNVRVRAYKLRNGITRPEDYVIPKHKRHNIGNYVKLVRLLTRDRDLRAVFDTK